MRDMEQRADRTAHAMDDRYRGIVEGDPGFQRRQRHLDPGFLIVAMLIGICQIVENPLDGAERKGVGKRLGQTGGVGFNRVAQGVDAGRAGHALGRGHRELRVDDRQIRNQTAAF